MRAYVISRSGVSAFVFALLVAVAFAAAAPALAQSGGVSCFRSPAKLPDSAVAKFMANPAGLLAEHPQGGPTLVGAARTLAGSDVRTVDALIELARNATPELKTDVATGLANTAASCAWTRPDIAGVIQEKIANAGDVPLATAFLSVLRAGGTAALGGGAGGPSRDLPRIGGGAVGSAASEPSTPPEAGTVNRLPLVVSPAKSPDSAVAKFIANPTGWLADHPQGGPTLIGAARSLAGSDVRTIDLLIEVARKATPEQKADIAAGLANTAARTRPDITRLIREKVAAAADASLSLAFLSVLRAAPGRRGVDTGSTVDGTGVSTGGGTSVTGGSTGGGASVSSAGAATSGADGRSSGGALNRATRFNSNIRPR